MRLTRSRLVALAATLLMMACGLDIVGTQALDGGSADAEARDGMAADGTAADGETPDTSFVDVSVPDDAALDAGVDAAEAEAPDACASSCPALDVVADGGYPGFFPVAIVDPTTSCPTGYITTDGFEKPTAANATNACSCGTCTGTGGTCDQTASITLKHSDDSTCGTIGFQQGIDHGNCQGGSITFTQNNFSAIGPAPSSVGTCAVTTAAADKTKVTTVKHRTCAPPGCGENLCNLPTGTKICLAAAADLPCPPQAPVKTSVGTDFSVTCSACGCTPQTTCGGTLTLYSGNNCNGSSKDYPANMCQSTAGASNNSSSFQLTTQTVCASTTPGTPTTALAGTPGTICCAN